MNGQTPSPNNNTSLAPTQLLNKLGWSDDGAGVGVVALVPVSRSIILDGSVLSFATVAARKARRPLLIDIDHRQPRLQRTLGLAASPGLTDFLANKSDFAGIIRRGKVPGVDAVAFGRKRSNRFLGRSTERVGELLREARAEYELVVVSASSAQDASTTHEWLTFVDSVVLVADDTLRLGDAQRAKQQLYRSGVVVSGAVFLGDD